MTIVEFQQKIDALFPIHRKSEDFREDLEEVLNQYVSDVTSLDNHIKSKLGDWNTTKKRRDQLITAIKTCVNSYYEGTRHAAYISIYNQVNGIKGTSPLLQMIDLHEIHAGEFLWRGRVFDKNWGQTNKDMFHIPFEKRGYVKTQRYSASGYPCLYLGTTIHSCWEELGRPKFDDLMISGFRVTKSLKLLDIRRPKKEDFTEESLKDLLLRLPLILACSFVIRDKDENALFKPEYIVPQLLLETFINKNKKDRKKIEDLVLGIIYTSTKTKKDFNRPINFYENIAIPAIDVSKPNGHCPELANCFEITAPSCNEYEGLKKDMTAVLLPKRISDLQNPITQYEHSKMGILETRIKNPKLFTPEKLEY